MQHLDGSLVVSASDLVAHLACRHVTWVDGLAANGHLSKPRRNDPMLELLRQRGLDHERTYLDLLSTEGRSIVNLDQTPSSGAAAPEEGRGRAADLRDSATRTRQALVDGEDVVYQGTFLDDVSSPWWLGHADFLRRVDSPSTLGPWSYEPEDTKLSRVVRAAAVLQLCEYAEQVARLQGVAPEAVHIVLGGHDRVTVRLADVSAYYRATKARFIDSLQQTDEPYPLPTSHCRICSWAGRCHQRWDDDDHLSRVASLTRDNTRKLEAAGVGTMTGLATLPDGMSVPGINQATLERLRVQARLQHDSLAGERPLFEVVQPIEPGMGLAGLPAPDPGDLFYDIEGHPYVGPDGLEYLHGIGWEHDGDFRFDGWWAHSPAEERQVFERLIDFIVERRREHPGMHVFHYAPYERTAIGKLMGRYGTREEEVDSLLRSGVFVDLYRAVRQGVRIGVSSYSIKKLEPLYMKPREGDIGNGGSSVIAYETWLTSGDESVLDEIELYNRDDVESTWRLRRWLEERRSDLLRAGDDVPRPTVAEPEASAPIDPEVEGLLDALNVGRQEYLDAAADDETLQPDDDSRARWLMADLLQWHRREAKPEWWAYFERRDQHDTDDFVADSETLGGLQFVGEVDRVKRSTIFRYAFDPTQDHKFRPGSDAFNPAALRDGTSGGGNAVIAVDNLAGTIDLGRGNGRADEHPEALMPNGPINTTVMRESLRRVASALLASGIDELGPARSARQLLARRAPDVIGVAPGTSLRKEGETTLAAATRLMGGLHDSYLPVQGPPGAGKTYTAATAILKRVKDERRVGITAFTHSAIGNLIEAIIKEAEEHGLTPSIVQKITDGHPGVDHPFVVRVEQPAGVVDALPEADIVAGTAWLFARDDMVESVDTLVVDEAGQLSLANVVAVAPAGRNLVLVGDPQQLAQPSKGTHPEGAGASALEHVLGDHATVPPEAGLFLDRTWRMHPDICAFISEQVYDGKLESEPHTAVQTIAGEDLPSGSGLCWLPVPHERNRVSSTEEAEALRAVYDSLIGRRWTNEEGVTADLTPEDILAVAPYTAQVHELAIHLPAGARVGTVDKFQGQEAAVVLVSMAASSAEEAPRGMEFLYSRHRFNVAVSRAKVLCVVAASPTLLDVHCNTVEQMRLANMLCRYVEMSDTLTLPVLMAGGTSRSR